MSSSRKSAPAREPLDINLDCKEYVLSGDPDNIVSLGRRSTRSLLQKVMVICRC